MITILYRHVCAEVGKVNPYLSLYIYIFMYYNRGNLSALRTHNTGLRGTTKTEIEKTVTFDL